MQLFTLVRETGLTPDELHEVDDQIIEDWTTILYYEGVRHKRDMNKSNA